jgi:hypothetical protein
MDVKGAIGVDAYNVQQSPQLKTGSSSVQEAKTDVNAPTSTEADSVTISDEGRAKFDADNGSDTDSEDSATAEPPATTTGGTGVEPPVARSAGGTGVEPPPQETKS